MASFGAGTGASSWRDDASKETDAAQRLRKLCAILEAIERAAPGQPSQAAADLKAVADVSAAFGRVGSRRAAVGDREAASGT
mmetsp:Transcript_26504/g.81487  ORF Transcript_26504/g.81487 Transcript_26504/m.81487 type:complete len:82 (+) Transcript_26504:160-405(+)